MTPEQRFARWIRAAAVSFALLFAYFVVADLMMPLTPQARAMREITQVAPELSGRVIEVAVENHSRVRKGDLLFRLDPEPFHIAVEKAQLTLEQVQRDNARLEASLAAARAELQAAEADARELARERDRLRALIDSHAVSQQLLDQTAAAYETAAAKVAAARASVEELRVQRGETGPDNLQLRRAGNNLADARLDLERTEVRASRDAVVSNLQLEAGDYAAVGGPVLALVGNELDITADFREKSLRHLRPGDLALVTFDASPGRIFAAHATSIDAGVRDGQLPANGQLVDIPTSSRWVRDAQRLRLHLALEAVPSPIPVSGARATVQLIPSDHPIAAFFARLQIHLISLLHYVY
ncbi:HlyD family secretion protein [Microbulbifer halophilus]|uniref:HlyD family secretion protein n=1 Tax=Microbulbifer halophilus TaxID=453963 RepID=A0ABW5ECF6_9GAMM|nr:HlyD family secretion protein [Microbulbifer halophilus]MCW8127223.1 HlyD family secretion protein [Microbulbifer halophilus]